VIADWAIARMRVSAADPNVLDPGSVTPIIRVVYTITNHRAGWLAFGPDGYLYASTGDGGEQDPQNAASDLTKPRGKVLRIDVTGPDGVPGTPDDDAFPADPERNYAVPDTNPFLATPGAAPEIWAYGLRNPWRCSFDRATGDLWIGDVGQLAREEIDFQPARSPGGLFYGWRCVEGTLPTGYAGCTTPLPPSVPPAFEYPHTSSIQGVQGSSAVGGYVYRGCAVPSLSGKYVFGDWIGRIWAATVTTNTSGNVVLNAPVFLNNDVNGGSALGTMVSLGEDARGELYYVIWNQTAGAVYKIEPRTTTDCNHNGVADACDIAGGASRDANGNGVPDECECRADYDGVNGVGLPDVFAFLTEWFAQSPRSDYNGVNGVEILDIFDFLTAWFVGC
jgi:glucose/arabinose dehydrogenase